MAYGELRNKLLRLISMDGQILYAQILIQTMRVFKDCPVVCAALHLYNAMQNSQHQEFCFSANNGLCSNCVKGFIYPDGDRSNCLTRNKLPESTLPYFGDIFTSSNLENIYHLLMCLKCIFFFNQMNNYVYLRHCLPVWSTL